MGSAVRIARRPNTTPTAARAEEAAALLPWNGR